MEYPKQFENIRPFCNLYHSKLLVVIDWKTLTDTSQCSMIGKTFPSRARFVELPFIDHESFVTYSKQSSSSSSSATAGPDATIVVDHTTAVALDHIRDKSSGQPPAVTLQECLRVYAGVEEHLEDNSWNCEICCKASRGVVQTSLSRLPEILVVHLKRFGMTARWREKIRTRVMFPLTGLDMSPYLAGTL